MFSTTVLRLRKFQRSGDRLRWCTTEARKGPIRCEELPTEHIEDGYEKRLTTGAVFVDLSAAYDTVNHRRLLSKVLEIIIIIIIWVLI